MDKSPNRARIKRKPALPPGTLLHVGEKKVDQVQIDIATYNPEELNEKRVQGIEDLRSLKSLFKSHSAWINIYGLHDLKLISEIGSEFSIHPLVLEDMLNTKQRPKLEDYEEYLFIVCKMVTLKKDGKSLEKEQVSLILGKNYLLCFQEKEGDVFKPVRKRLRSGKGRIRSSGADYLAYALIDAIVDHYFIVLDRLEETIDKLDYEILHNPQEGHIRKLHGIKKSLSSLRKAVWPLRDVLGTFYRGESKLIQKRNLIFFRDVYDNNIQVMDSLESYRESVSTLMDIYLSTISNRMNQVMKILTVMASIFIPLTFITGVYGMNFKYMPELELRWGYPAVWCVMMAVASGMILYFKRKGWFK